MEKTVREFVAVVQAMPWIIHLRKGFYAVNACTVSATYEEALTAERAALKARRGRLKLVCFCAPQRCHGEVVAEAITGILAKGWV